VLAVWRTAFGFSSEECLTALGFDPPTFRMQ
jgi:hypothetical protein